MQFFMKIGVSNSYLSNITIPNLRVSKRRVNQTLAKTILLRLLYLPLTNQSIFYIWSGLLVLGKRFQSLLCMHCLPQGLPFLHTGIFFCYCVIVGSYSFSPISLFFDCLNHLDTTPPLLITVLMLVVVLLEISFSASILRSFWVLMYCLSLSNMFSCFSGCLVKLPSLVFVLCEVVYFAYFYLLLGGVMVMCPNFFSGFLYLNDEVFLVACFVLTYFGVELNPAFFVVFFFYIS